MEMTANTHAATVTTMSFVTEITTRVQMGVDRIIAEVIVNSVSVSNPFTDVLRTTDPIKIPHFCAEIRAYYLNMTVVITYIRKRENNNFSFYLI